MSELQASESGPKLLLQGLDSLYVSYFLEMTTSRLDFDELAYAREKLKQDGERFCEITLGTETFALKSYGAKPYKYVLGNEDFEIRLTETMQPTCHVRFASKGLWLKGCQALLDRVGAWYRSMGMTVLRPEVVARADFAFDFHVPEVDFDEGNFLSRAAKDTKWRKHQRVQTFQFGTGDIVVRVYDKIAEIREQSQKVWFHDLWGCDDAVWRVEFQVRSKRLAAGGIKSLLDLECFRGDLLRELADKHTKLLTPSLDRNRSRWPLHPLWTSLLRAIDALPQTGLIKAYDPKNELNYRLYEQAKSLYGSFKGIGALMQIITDANVPLELEDIIERLDGLLDEHHNPTKWRQDIATRVTAHALGQW